MIKTTSRWLFWISVSTIVYTYIGFPLIVLLRGLLRPRPVNIVPHTPKVSIIIAAYNEESIIKQKLDNTFALNYPNSEIEVIVASDGSDDTTNQIVREYGAPQVRLLTLPRQGKNQTLNHAVSVANGEILVFSDADSMLKPDALIHLVAPFSDPAVGGVGGDYQYTTVAGEGSGERTYWSLDRALKQIQSEAGSMTSATGQIYALRRSLFVPIPDGVTDDFFVSVQAPVGHQRLVFAPQATAYGPVAASSSSEFRRKVRVITAGLRGVWTIRQALNPVKYGFFAVQLFSHKVLRRLIVVPLLVLSVTAPLLWRHGWFYKLITIGKYSVHSAGILGYVLRNTRIGQVKVLSLPFFFEMVNIAAVVAVANLFRRERHDIWVPQRSQIATDIGERG